MTRHRIAIAIIAIIILSLPVVARAGYYEPMTAGQARSLAKQMQSKWVDNHGDGSTLWLSRPTCYRLGRAKFECDADVWENAAGTYLYANLTIDVWNSATATNGIYWSHQQVVHVTR